MRTLDEVPLSPRDRRAVEAAARLLRERYPVEEVILFGSKARGDDSPESDIHLLVLTSRELGWPEQGEIAARLVDLGLLHGVYIEPLIHTREEWWRGIYQALPIHREIRTDGVAA